MTNILVRWVSPTTGEPREQLMDADMTAEWWAMASYPVQETASFTEVPE